MTEKVEIREKTLASSGGILGRIDQPSNDSGLQASPTESQLKCCPNCGCNNIDRDGFRYLSDGSAKQRWVCNKCDYRFSERNSNCPTIAGGTINTSISLDVTRQVCVNIEAKNLTAIETKTIAGETPKNAIDVNGKVIEYCWWLKKDGKAEQTIESRAKLLKILVKRGANLYEPETIKETIANQTWSNGRKNNAVDAYSSYLRMVGGRWNAPLYHTIRKLPFIPKETEIDQLIAGTTQRMSCFLQMAKETGARCGELWRLLWDDIDFESKIVNIVAEKNSNPRVVHLSNKLLEMLQNLPKTYGDRVFSFPSMPVDHFGSLLSHQRKRLAIKLSNPRLRKIHFHTLRYWKGTMLYHETKDMYYVMLKLGHKNIKNTLLYVQLEEALFQGETNYISKVAKTEKEICSLIEAGFEYVTEFDGAKIFKKRKL